MLGTQAFNAKGRLSICTGVTIEARRASDPDDDQVRRDVLRLLLHLCYYNARMSAQRFVGGLGAVAPETAAFFDTDAHRALYANLASGLFATIYAKLLIPRLGT